jgi:formylmethanofuran dehydrogenase subunit C
MNISNKLVDYTIVYDARREVNSGKYQDKKNIIEEVKKAYKTEVEDRIGKEVIVVYDWRTTHSGMEIILYAYEY